MPVHKEAFQRLMQAEDADFSHVRYRQVYKVLLSLYETSTFVSVPAFENYGELEKRFGASLRDVLSSYRGTRYSGEGDPESVVRASLTQMKKRLAVPFQ